MKKIFLAAVLVAMSASAFSQGATVLFPAAVNQNGQGLSFATVTFCSLPTTINTAGVCQTPITVFKDQALTQPYSSAILTDGVGIFPPNLNTLTSIWFSPAANLCFTLTTSSMLSPATNPCVPFSVGVQLNGGSLSLNGNITQTQTTAATNVANQSSFLDCMNASYWTGAISATDQWCFQDVLGTGANPTTTFTLTHGGSPGSSGAATFSIPGNVSVGGTLTTKSENRICKVDQYAGADLGAKFAAAIADSGCKILDATGFTGAQVAAATMTFSQPITLLLGNYNLTLNGNPGINMNSVGAAIKGLGRNQSIITAGANNDLIQTNQGAELIDNVEIEGASLATNIGIHVVAGSSQKFDRIYCNAFGSTCLQFEATMGSLASVTNSLLQPSGAFSVPAFVINGTDGCGAGTSVPRQFVNIGTGGHIVDIQGGATVMIVNSVISGITMTSSACKLTMTGNRILTNNVTFSGINHSVVGNLFAGVLTLDNTVSGSVIGPNVDSGLTDNSGQQNIILETTNALSQYAGTIPQLAIGPAAHVQAGVGLFISPTTLSGTTQFGEQVANVTTSAATVEGAGVLGRADTAAAAYAQALNVGFHAQTPTVGAGSTITEWNGLRIEPGPTAGSKFAIRQTGTADQNLFFGPMRYSETTAPSGAAASDMCYADSTAHALKCSYNNGTYFQMPQTIGTGNVTTAGTAVTNGTCQAQTNITVTGTAVTDGVTANIGAALPATWQTGIVLSAHPTATNTVTVYLCNPTAGSITPAATQVNVRVNR